MFEQLFGGFINKAVIALVTQMAAFLIAWGAPDFGPLGPDLATWLTEWLLRIGEAFIASIPGGFLTWLIPNAPKVPK